ncbi:MAG: ABC transporter ATP-binding protein [Xanthomonadales bacterium]|nr:ABC transporter ATP-binding protein [Xanthomonadales bacterium]
MSAEALPDPAAAGSIRPTALAVEAVDVSLAGTPVLVGATLALARGELGCLLGPSGCGKTTLLRAIAGLQAVDAGCIQLDGNTLSRPGRTVPPERRGVGLVFQDLALFPHLDVAANVGFGLHRLDRGERRARVDALLATLSLAGLAGRFPHELSGGQQQRVAIARALAPQPALLLLDEPFSSLDAGLRKELRGHLRATLRELGCTALLVTHDQEEAMAFADRVAVLRDGRVVQFDTPWQLYHRPADAGVAGFVGEGVLLPAWQSAGAWHCALGPLPGTLAVSTSGPARVLVRPDDLVADPASAVRARVERVEFRGAEELVELRLAGGERVLALWPSHERTLPGQETGVLLRVPHVVLFPG